MATCVLRRSVLLGLRNLSAIKKHTQLRKINERLIHTSPALLERYYTDKHEWVNIPEGADIGTVGITHYAQDKLGEVVFIQLPEMSQVLEADGDAGVLESVKAASDIFSPMSGEVTDLNTEVEKNPGLINQDCYGAGWLFKMKLSDLKEVENLLTEDGYTEYLKTQE